MRDDIEATLRLAGGATGRALLRRSGVPRTGVDHEVRRGELVRVFPRAYVRPWDLDQQEQLERAALLSVGAPVLLSHLTVLRQWRLLDELADLSADARSTVHLTVPAPRYCRPHPGRVVHRVQKLPPVDRRNGVPVVALADAVVTSTPLLSRRERRAPAIAAVRQRLVTPAQLRAAATSHTRLAGRRGVLELVDLLDAGCESELEIWGLLHVFDAAGLRHGVRQRVIPTRGRTYRADLAYEAERVIVELDGDRYHSTREQRERDRTRDAALAAVGWQTVRFSWARLTTRPDECRRELLAILAARRR